MTKRGKITLTLSIDPAEPGTTRAALAVLKAAFDILKKENRRMATDLARQLKYFAENRLNEMG